MILSGALRGWRRRALIRLWCSGASLLLFWQSQLFIYASLHALPDRASVLGLLVVGWGALYGLGTVSVGGLL
jgi:hypothetical protein